MSPDGAGRVWTFHIYGKIMLGNANFFAYDS